MSDREKNAPPLFSTAELFCVSVHLKIAGLHASLTPCLPIDLAELPEDWPEVQYNVYPSGVSQVYDGKNYGLLQATLVSPKSRGSVSIQSSSMSDAPLIDPNWLSEPADLEVLAAGFKRVRQALESSAMAPVLIGGEQLPGSSVETDEEIEEYLRSSSAPLYHAFATNKMGQSSDPSAVVDSHGKVYGVSRCEFLHSFCGRNVTNGHGAVRVIDCSSFPFLPAGPAPQIQVCKSAVSKVYFSADTG